jgi:hypothetical protein
MFRGVQQLQTKFGVVLFVASIELELLQRTPAEGFEHNSNPMTSPTSFVPSRIDWMVARIGPHSLFRSSS